jgi:phosphatidylglycerol:prolipoprotein diacylglycerol transferase
LISEGFSLGPLTFRLNGLLLVLGIAVAALLAARESKRRGFDPETIYYLFLPMVIWGTVGARIWHILTPPLSSVQLGLTTGHYLTHFLDVLAFWLGGYGIPGAWIGGSIALFFFARKNELSFWELADVLAPGLALAQAIGRLGNYFNQELYGLPTALPWKIFVEPAYRLVGFEAVEYYHPLFAYEMILNFINLFFLLWIVRRFVNVLNTGSFFLAYLGFYSLVRFLLEFLRLDVALVSGLNINQVFFGFVFILAGIGFYLRQRLVRKL